jgi:predicted 3-demethylubiquinone-9 3-methyltransferase (glyoxalase superfamily)
MTKNVTPFLMYAGEAEAAMQFYASLFPGAEVDVSERFDEKGPGKPGSIKAATLTLGGQRLMFFDSPVKHAFTFTPAISLFVECDSASDVDALFAKLSEGGQVLMGLDAYPFAKRFAWVQDKFGVSWQLRYA